MTYEQALALTWRDQLHHNTHKNADGTCQRWWVNGKVRTWKRDAKRIEVPIKYGLKTCITLTASDLDLVHLASECPGHEEKQQPYWVGIS